MNTRWTPVLVALGLCLYPVASHAQLASYTQNFETLNPADPNALSAEGWTVYVNNFGTSHELLGGYGFPAPNGGNAASALVSGQGGVSQGLQQLAVYSNYNDQHAVVGFVETNVYKEQTIGAGDVGKTVVFHFDAKRPFWMGALYHPTAAGFLKVLNPAAGWSMTHFRVVDLTESPETWGTHEITLLIDPSLPGQVLQFGFMNTQSGYDPTVVFYDNVAFAPDQATPAGATTWGRVKGLYR